MWYVLLSIALAVYLGFLTHKKYKDKTATTCVSASSLIMAGLLCYPIMGVTTGLSSAKDDGQFEGFIGGINHEGLLFKTQEMELYRKVENWAEVLKSKESGEDHKHEIRVSLANEIIQEKAHGLIGKRVVVEYRYWPIPVLTQSGTSYEVTNITLAP
ncbi:hypothetical protein [uncultured Pseudoteredinibacter sp.]|uniref:hypothetical protein n=1 Tax=uncultured Pseudoteredinibacter sp. TaxID=1641701 RepID=UPI0026320CF9|nr:hypothetical protein [uncultured Pseudoteredinibacter sp.]